VNIINGTEDDETLQGSLFADTIYGLGGNDIIYAMDGDDIVYGGADHDTIYGGIGNDTIFAGSGNDDIYGGLGDDILVNVSGNTRMNGGEGNDTLNGGTDHDTLEGGTGNDLIDGGLADDIISGGEGDDTLIGGEGRDRLYGEDGNDIIFADISDIAYTGGEGVDRLNLTSDVGLWRFNFLSSLGFESVQIRKEDDTLIQTFSVLDNGIERTIFYAGSDVVSVNDPNFSAAIFDLDIIDSNGEWTGRHQYRNLNNENYLVVYILDDETFRYEHTDTENSEAWHTRIDYRDENNLTTSVFTTLDNTDTEFLTWNPDNAFTWDRSVVYTDVTETKAYSTLTAFYIYGPQYPDFTSLDITVQELDNGNRVTTDYNADYGNSFGLTIFTEDANDDELFTSVLQTRNEAGEMALY